MPYRRAAKPCQRHLPGRRLSLVRQRGAIAILSAVMLIGLISILALVVDTGRLYAAQQKLENTARLAAIGAARAAGGCRVPIAGDMPENLEAAGIERAQAVINSNYPGEQRVSLKAFERGLVQTDEQSARRVFVSTTAAGPTGATTRKPNAARVTLVDTGYKPLLSLFSDETPKLSASAGAIDQPQAQLRFGTTLAQIAPNALLGRLVGLDTGIADQGSLLDANVRLGDLLNIDTGLVTPEQLVNLRVNDLFGGVSNVLSGLAAGATANIRDAVGDQPLSEVLSIAGPVGRDVSVNVGSIVNTLAQLTAQNRGTPITLPLSLLGGTGDVNSLLDTGGDEPPVKLAILEPPKLVIGPAGTDVNGGYYTTAYSAQIALELNVDLGIKLPGLGDLLRLKLPLVIRAGSGYANLASITCPSRPDDAYRVTINGRTSLAGLAVGSLNDDSSLNQSDPVFLPVGDFVLSLTNEPGSNGLELGGQRQFESTIDGGPPTVVFDDPDDLPLPFPVSTDIRTTDLLRDISDLPLRVEISRNTGTCTRLFGCVISNIIDGVGGVVTGTVNIVASEIVPIIANTLATVLEPILAGIVDPLLNTLGLSVAAPEILLEGIDDDQSQLFCADRQSCYPDQPAR